MAHSDSGHIFPYYLGVQFRYRVPRTLLQAQRRLQSAECRLILRSFPAYYETNVLPGLVREGKLLRVLQQRFEDSDLWNEDEGTR